MPHRCKIGHWRQVMPWGNWKLDCTEYIDAFAFRVHLGLRSFGVIPRVKFDMSYCMAGSYSSPGDEVQAPDATCEKFPQQGAIGTQGWVGWLPSQAGLECNDVMQLNIAVLLLTSRIAFPIHAGFWVWSWRKWWWWGCYRWGLRWGVRFPPGFGWMRGWCDIGFLPAFF